jgi:AraC-like DNA-binding protein
MSAPAALDATLVRHYGAEGGRHAHEHAQVLLGLEGTLQMEVEGRAAWVDAACGLVVPAGATHAYRAERAARVLVLDCAPGPATERLRRFALPPDWQARWLHRAAAPHALADTLLERVAGAPTLAARRRIDLAALAERIDADLARRWTVADLAAACCLSPQRLRARFAEALGLAPLEFVRARRLDRAAQLLRQGLALDAVALQVGYGGASALSAALRRERDTGARELRRRRALRES